MCPTRKGFLADEDPTISFTYAGWCQAALPHRRLPDDMAWQVRSDNVTLIVEGGMRPGNEGKPVPVGVPYGSRARLILFYFQGEAVRNRTRDIELGRSLTAWMTRMGMGIGGKSATLVRDQSERISRCRLSFNIRSGPNMGLVNQNIIDKAFLTTDAKHGDMFANHARLSEGFYEELCRHSVPLHESAIKQIANNSLALDLYAWLAYRLHALDAPLTISWAALQAQFGQHIAQRFHFRAHFRENLLLAQAVYPESRVDVTPEHVVLHPSPAPVSPTRMAVRSAPRAVVGRTAQPRRRERAEAAQPMLRLV